MKTTTAASLMFSGLAGLISCAVASPLRQHPNWPDFLAKGYFVYNNHTVPPVCDQLGLNAPPEPVETGAPAADCENLARWFQSTPGGWQLDVIRNEVVPLAVWGKCVIEAKKSYEDVAPAKDEMHFRSDDLLYAIRTVGSSIEGDEWDGAAGMDCHNAGQTDVYVMRTAGN